MITTILVEIVCSLAARHSPFNKSTFFHTERSEFISDFTSIKIPNNAADFEHKKAHENKEKCRHTQ